MAGHQIQNIECGIDKDEFVINGESFKGQKEQFTFLRLNFSHNSMTFLEGRTGLYISYDVNINFSFEDTFDKYQT